MTTTGSDSNEEHVRRELAPHDMGGQDAGPMDMEEKPKQWWERQVDAMVWLLSGKKIFRVHQLRHQVESLGPLYDALSYYERWAIGLSQGLLEAGLITTTQLDQALGHPSMTEEVSFFPCGIHVMGAVH